MASLDEGYYRGPLHHRRLCHHCAVLYKVRYQWVQTVNVINDVAQFLV